MEGRKRSPNAVDQFQEAGALNPVMAIDFGEAGYINEENELERLPHLTDPIGYYLMTFFLFFRVIPL